mgnify:FL=1
MIELSDQSNPQGFTVQAMDVGPSLVVLPCDDEFSVNVLPVLFPIQVLERRVSVQDAGVLAHVVAGLALWESALAG